MSAEPAAFLPVLYGLALGDALGWPVEFQKVSQIRATYGPRGISEPPDPALFTDDTQMSLAVARALTESGGGPLEPLMAAVSSNFVDWLKRPDTMERAPGNTCLKAVHRLAAGQPWQSAGIPESKGCGSAMRAAPIGYFYHNDAARLKEVAHAVGFATHQHPAADAAAIAAAYLVSLALDGVHPSEFSARVLQFCDGISEEFDYAILRVNHTLGWTDTQSALNHIGQGWVGEEAVALALYCCLKFPDDYVSAVRLGANIDGDSDSVACIAGGILGARLGLAGLPAGWISRLERRAELEALAADLTRARSRRTP